MLSKAQKRLYGAGMIIVFVLIVVIGVSKPNPFKAEYSYDAVFDTAQGLGAIDRDVRIAGVKVGTIGEVERVGDDARAELILNQDFVIHEDARASMRPHTLFEGSNFVDLFPGSPSAPVLEEGGVIPVTQTSSYTTLDEALRVLKPEIRLNLRQLAEVGGETLQGPAIDGVQETLKNLPALSRNLAPAMRALGGANRRELASAISGISETVDAVAEKEAELIPFVQRYNHTVAALTVDGGAPLDATLASLPGALQELYDTAPSLTALIGRLEQFSDEINPALPELASALEVTTPVLLQAAPVLERATPLVANARLLISRLARAAPGLKRLLSLVNEALEKRDSLNTFLEPSIYDEDVTNAEQLAGAFAAANGSFRTFQRDNPNGNGHAWRLGVFLNPSIRGTLGSLLGLRTPASNQPFSYDASCPVVAQVSKDAAELLERMGGCK